MRSQHRRPSCQNVNRCCHRCAECYVLCFVGSKPRVCPCAFQLSVAGRNLCYITVLTYFKFGSNGSLTNECVELALWTCTLTSYHLARPSTLRGCISQPRSIYLDSIKDPADTGALVMQFLSFSAAATSNNNKSRNGSTSQAEMIRMR